MWIEIAVSQKYDMWYASQPARAVWIEIAGGREEIIESLESQPARAVWIEISATQQ